MSKTTLLSLTSTVSLTLLLASVIAHAQEPTKEVKAEKKEAVSSLDARINNLQNARDCIKTAKSKEAIAACRRDLRSNRHKLPVDPKDENGNIPAATPAN